MPKLTSDMLKGCCDDQIAEFERRFPDGVTVETREEAIAAASAVANGFDWDWAAKNLLSDTALEAYKAEKAPAWEDYMDAKTAAWEVYEAATTTEWKDYAPARVRALGVYMGTKAREWEDYRAATAPARDVYETAMAPAQEAYMAAKATAFAAAWFDDNKLDANRQTESV